MMFDKQQVLLERYELQQQLGRTGAGRQTWLAIDLHTHQSVIVKLLAFNPQMQWDELKLFEREAQVLQSLDHARIPEYHDYFSIDDQILWFGLVQAYIPGRSLQDLLDQGEVITESQARQVAIELLAVLNYLHQLPQPVLHRDIKPSNLIRGEDGLMYLVDFGAVQDRATLTGMTFTVVGTCGYAPLEQFWGRAVPASDLYALGGTLIHLGTGSVG
jgi:serine/threonine protein kinase